MLSVVVPAVAWMEVRWNDTILFTGPWEGGERAFSAYMISGMETPLLIPPGDYIEVSWRRDPVSVALLSPAR
jgi:hypothetical protein